jgi:hypothetical protein
MNPSFRSFSVCLAVRQAGSAPERQTAREKMRLARQFPLRSMVVCPQGQTVSLHPSALIMFPLCGFFFHFSPERVTARNKWI